MIILDRKDLLELDLSKFNISNIQYQSSPAFLIQWNDAKRFILILEKYMYENKIRYQKMNRDVRKIIIQKTNDSLYKIIY